MTDTLLFDLFRRFKRRWTKNSSAGLTQAEVDEINAVLREMQGEPQEPRKLVNPAAFFDAVRHAFGSLSQDQVDGFERLLAAYGAAQWPIAFAAYGLATGWHETKENMQPVKEAYWLSEQWRKDNLRYYPWYGRGDVQLTWQRNYERADEALDLGGALVANPDLAMRPDISARVMTWGMRGGAFTGKKLSDYLPLAGKATFDAYRQARQIINGHDDDEAIAKKALVFENALDAGGWA